ncbi:hypothetical protein [Corallococcus macrosporus]|uniref:HK97 gp10 family phage protein n=1 Tax=Myxococcus fulvus (strain ATCC BAA-855 / HW-1) TaxID=483219 RepID=F8C7Z1_MYXFH|nr:hypothetical protein [Corallococcus macrosporus]AEI66943.1 hypothetical protein LILAB_25250 [Corallococcus macrosporus]
MPVRVQLKASALARLRQRPKEVLQALDFPLRDSMRRTLDLATFLVPRRGPDERAETRTSREGPPEPPLADTGFVSGPEHNMQRLSVSWTAGFEHPAAGPVHEGFHWGDQIIRPPPHFLKKAFRRSRSIARKGVAQVLTKFLQKQFPRR